MPCILDPHYPKPLGVDKVAEDHPGDQKLHTEDENLTLTLLTQNRHK
jgi:hypothetical protein